MLIPALIILTASLLIVSKFFDCFTTVIVARKFHDKAGLERNPIGRFLMKKLGFQTAIWGVFALVVIFVSLLAYYIYLEDNSYTVTGFTILGFFISIAHFDVARANYYQTRSFFTRFLSVVYSKFG